MMNDLGQLLCRLGLHKVRTVPLVYPKGHEANSYDSAYPITTRMCVRWGCPKERAEVLAARRGRVRPDTERVSPDTPWTSPSD